MKGTVIDFYRRGREGVLIIMRLELSGLTTTIC